MIRRQRGDVTKSLEILHLDEQILTKYQAITRAMPDDNPQREHCVAELTYKFNLLASNANQQARKKKECLKAFRAGARYEIEQQYSFERQKLAFLIAPISYAMGNEDYMSIDVLDQTSDDQIWAIMMSSLQNPTNVSSPPSNVEPWICDGCGEVEELCGDYKCCSKCKKAQYCSRDCQVKHWKMHKPDCKKNRANIASRTMITDIKTMCKATIRNYEKAFESSTGEEISDEKRKAAFPGLVQIARTYVLEHSDLTPDDALESSRSDLQFLKKIQEFMESTGFLSNDPQLQDITDNERLTELAAERMEVNDDRLLEAARSSVASILPFVLVRLQIAPDDQEQTLACHHVVATIKSYVAEHPEYQTPENFDAFMQEDKSKEIIAESFCNYFNDLAAASS